MLLPDLDQAQAIIERGERCARLINDEDFSWIVDDLTNYHLAALVAAPPGPSGAEAVSHHHLMQHSLTDLVATLKGYVEAGEAMKKALLEGDDEEDI